MTSIDSVSGGDLSSPQEAPFGVLTSRFRITEGALLTHTQTHNAPDPGILRAMSTDKRAPLGAGSLFQTTNNGRQGWTYQTSHTDPLTGKRSYIRGFASTPKQAIQRHSINLNRRINRAGTITKPRDTSPVLSTYVEQWLERIQPTIGAETYRKYSRDLEIHLLPKLGKKRLNELNDEVLHHHFYKTLENTGTSARLHAYKTFNIVLNYATDRGHIDRNPLKLVPIPEHETKVQRNDTRFINKRVNIATDLLKWISQPGNPYEEHRNRILLMFLGLRRAEILGLEWSSITQLTRKGKAKLTIDRQLSRHEKHTGKQGYYIKPHTKSKKPRTIYLPEIWRKALLDEKKKNRIAREAQFSNLVFLTPAGNHYTYKQHDELWREILTAYYNKTTHKYDRLPDSEYFRPHAARHITASLLFSSGVSLIHAQQILGHSTAAMTQHYTHLMEEGLISSTAALAKALRLD